MIPFATDKKILNLIRSEFMKKKVAVFKLENFLPSFPTPTHALASKA